jgi:hypothetical protein
MSPTVMSWTDSFIVSVVAGALIAVVSAFIAYLASQRRNRNLEQAICDGLAPRGLASVRVRRDETQPNYSDERVGLGIENKTGHAVTIRRVTAWSGRKGVDLELYAPAVKSPLKSFRTGALTNQWGWVELPPFSRAIWFLEENQDNLGTLDRIDVELVYQTLLGNAKKITIHPSAKALPELLRHLQEGLPGKNAGESAA